MRTVLRYNRVAERVMSRKQDMLKEYDFSKGERGKYAERYAAGSNVVVLPPDLARAFSTAESVHNALRGLVTVSQNVIAAPPSKDAKKR